MITTMWDNPFISKDEIKRLKEIWSSEKFKDLFIGQFQYKPVKQECFDCADSDKCNDGDDCKIKNEKESRFAIF